MLSIALNNKEHQGKYHLLAILLIPGLLVAFFLSNNWWIPISLTVIAAALIWLAFRN
jgi:hypothetical protein